jgi:hypothetical protein
MKIKTTSLIAYVLTSFILYATAVCLLEQHRTSQYNGEQFIIASAVSHTLLGTPIGSVYWGVVKQFVYQPTGTIQTTLSNISSSGLGQTDLGPLWTTLPDGLGIVMVGIISVLFSIFGVTLAVFPALAIGLSAVSAIAFAIRFRDGRLLLLVVHFCLLTVLLLARTSTETGPFNEFPIGGLRYFGLLAMLPAFHIMLEIFDRRVRKLTAIGASTAALQIFIFALCLNVRSASIYMLLAIATLVAATIVAKSSFIDWRAVIAKFSAALSALMLCTIIIYALSPADYRNEGRVTGVFWHRILISLGANPSWPFGNLTTQYNLCVLPYTQPMRAGVADVNGGCMWTQHVLENKMPPGELVRGVGSAQYENVVRTSFFNVVAEYPSDVAKTFLYYKFKLAFDETKDFFKFKVDFREPKYQFLIMCVAAQVLLVLLAWFQTAVSYRYTAYSIAMFFSWSIFPLIVAWATLHTVIDLGYWCFAVFAFVILALLETVKAKTASESEAPAR